MCWVWGGGVEIRWDRRLFVLLGWVLLFVVENLVSIYVD